MSLTADPNYAPQAIALLGAMLETITPQEDTKSLFKNSTDALKI
jgi:hypothetical protein